MTEPTNPSTSTAARTRGPVRGNADQLAAMQAELVDVKAQVQALLGALQAVTQPSAPVPPRPLTVAQLVARAEATTTSSSLRTYRTGWRLLADGDPEHQVAGLGHRMCHEVLTSELEQLTHFVQRRAHQRNAAQDVTRHHAGRQQRHGNGVMAVYNAVSAWRRLFAIAENDGAILSGTNPAARLRKPSRRGAQRTWLPADRFSELQQLALSGGDDPLLDLMLVKFHLVTGARQEGALNLCLRHVEASRGMVMLDEKNGSLQAQPVPDWLAAELLDFARSRGATDPTDPVFRKRLRNGRSAVITRRRYNHLFERLQAAAEWVDQQQVCAHSLRHSSAHLVERHAGEAVARRFLRHSVSDVTGRYTKASIEEVAAAVVELWGGFHPLVTGSAAGTPNPTLIRVPTTQSA